jgi:acyl-CoA hydrolase/RimJ/RimL family protein N-acetyltransferase
MRTLITPGTTGWSGIYQGKKRNPAEAIALIRRGQRVFIGSSCGEPQALVRELAANAHFLTDLEIVRILRHGTIPLTLGGDPSLNKSFNVRLFYLGSAKPRAFSANKRFITPINLSALPRLFKSRQMPIHVALIQVSEPDEQGWMSLGVSVDVTLAAAQSADLVIAQVNPRMPRVLGNSSIHVNDVDVLVEHEEELLTIGKAPEFESAHLIAKQVAKLIPDGSTLQVSLGSTPQALLLGLSGKNDLGLHTQFMSDTIMDLMLKGVITNKKKGYNEGKAIASAAIGSRSLYDFVDHNPSVELHPSDYVNDATIISRHRRMVALNVAMAVDLTGQLAADALPYNHFSGVSGIMDFVRGAALSEEGKSVFMLPSTTLDGKTSRVIPSLEKIPVLVPRGDVQYVATEYGVVNLFGKSLQERSIAMISIAHPKFRDELFDKAVELGLLERERPKATTIRSIYPLDVEEPFMIAGHRVFFRPVRPTDERNIQEHFYNLDINDVMLRFLGMRKTFRREEVAMIYQVDYVHSLSIVAVIGEPGFERIIGVGGYISNPSNGMAEVGYSVVKEWQRRGVSTVIQRKLALHAKKQGIHGFVAYITPSNLPMKKLFQKLPYHVRRSFEDEVFALRASFDDPVADRPDEPNISISKEWKEGTETTS